MTDLLKIAENLAAAGLDHPAVDDAVVKLTNAATHPARGVVDEVAERRALNKALDALDTLSEQWATEIGLDAMCANLAKAEDVPAAIRAMVVQAWVEGAYAGRTSLQAAQPAVPSVPEDFVLVPNVATLDMYRAMAKWATPEAEYTNEQLESDLPDFQEGYAALIAATPKDQP